MVNRFCKKYKKALSFVIPVRCIRLKAERNHKKIFYNYRSYIDKIKTNFQYKKKVQSKIISKSQKLSIKTYKSTVSRLSMFS